ncbi:MAG: putative Pre-mRNA-splicing factor ATP-dependent RNA helicase DHX16 [Streblomastix strix]|uniref:Putative Pre-mRNA-splicing factor ATP-dependent RNA helicase DHX16 n=1 Tax=Streblomastix strix TaxID=222440 RepID=A0A5J4WVL6_9EUKA|nr:MAG: putative Pre-mRNA-splicing factor ATP-dependent RNA helicase DHX16 [Streblomastix strix]
MNNTKRIACAQPRRVAAMSVASHVAEEQGVSLGGEFGYTILFEDCTSERTIIQYMTDRMLLRAFLAEPDLSCYSVIMFDEAHERTIDTDILLGMLKDLCRLRKSDLRLIVSSAAMNSQKLSQSFDNAPILNVSDRMYDVEILYLKQPCFDFVGETIETILNIHQENLADGDILVILSGQEDIEDVNFRLERSMQKKLNEQAAIKD